jgi:hypothetical protein
MSYYDKPKFAIPGLMPTASPNRDAQIFTNFDGAVRLEVSRESEPADPKPVNWRILWNDKSEYCSNLGNEFITYEVLAGELITFLDLPAELLPIGTWLVIAEHDSKRVVFRVTRSSL